MQSSAKPRISRWVEIAGNTCVINILTRIIQITSNIFITVGLQSCKSINLWPTIYLFSFQISTWSLKQCSVDKVCYFLPQQFMRYVNTWSNVQFITYVTSSPWIWKGVSATLQSGRYTLLYPRGQPYTIFQEVYTLQLQKNTYTGERSIWLICCSTEQILGLMNDYYISGSFWFTWEQPVHMYIPAWPPHMMREPNVADI